MSTPFRPAIFACFTFALALSAEATTISGGNQVVETNPTPPKVTSDPAGESPNPPGEKPFVYQDPILSTTPQLPPKPDDFSLAMQAASADFKQKKFDEAMANLDKAEVLKPNNPAVLNFRGAVYTEKGDFDQARELYGKALTLNPSEFWPRFNLSEINFVQKKYDEARRGFHEMQFQFPKNELLQFKIALTYMLENNQDAAKVELEKIPFPSNTAAYYFGWAAWEFSRGNESEAKKWVAAGINIFGRQKTDYVYQSLADLHWLPLPRPQETAKSASQ